MNGNKKPPNKEKMFHFINVMNDNKTFGCLKNNYINILDVNKHRYNLCL
jgi:hypothetical protein